jgi:hypothetical protein
MINESIKWNKEKKTSDINVKAKAVPLHAMEALGGRGIAPTHCQLWH